MNMKWKYLILPLICSFLFSSNKSEYQNELVKYKSLPLNKSNYNFDGFNDFVDNSNKYYDAYLKYVNFDYFTKLELKKDNNYNYNNVSLFYLSNNITIYKEGYSLSIQNNKDYKCYELNTSSLFYWYFSTSFLDLRQDSTIYFIKDRYRVCYEKGKIKSILSYKDNLFYESELYRIDNGILIEEENKEKKLELLTIANIYLTEYF